MTIPPDAFEGSHTLPLYVCCLSDHSSVKKFSYYLLRSNSFQNPGLTNPFHISVNKSHLSDVLNVYFSGRSKSVKHEEKMKQKSDVSLVSVLKADPADRGGMIQILESFTKYSAVDSITGTPQNRVGSSILCLYSKFVWQLLKYFGI